MEFVDLFSGVGGFRIGLESVGHKCVFSSEIDKYARAVYEFKWEKPSGDITKIKATDIPDHDILCGGFPCQSFSIAGKRKGFQDIRGTLFAEIVRIAKVKRPRLLLLENVQGLLTTDSGRCFHTILLSLAELGYRLEWEVLNSKNFGVPQNRERVFIVGHFGEEPRREVFPIGQDEEISDGKTESGKGQSQTSSVTRPIRTKIDRGEDTFIQSYPHGYNPGWKKEYPNLRANSGSPCNELVCVGIIPESEKPNGNYLPRERVFSDEGIARALSTEKSQMPYVYAYDLYNNKLQPDRTPALKEPHHNDLRSIEGNYIRKFTPIECERLQGFPDNHTKFGIIDGKKVTISDSQRYKQMGNAITINVVACIAKKITESINNG